MLILYWCLIVVMMLGMIGAFIPGLPGTSLILAAIVTWGFAIQNLSSLAWPLGCAIVVLIFGFAIDFLAGYLGAKQAGASNAGQIGAVIGMFAGFLGLIPALPIGGPLLGLIIGPLLGAIIGEYSHCKDLNQSIKAGVGIVVGSVLGNLLQGILAIVPVAVFLATTWTMVQPF